MSTGSKPLSGTFPLYDSLSLTTHSGSLTATVMPEPANPVKPVPAELRVHSHSGGIRLDTRIPSPADDDDDDDDDAKRSSRAIWQREYRSAVTSHSSRIEARVVLGGKTLVQSHSGVLDVEAVIGPLVLAPLAGEGGQGQKGGKKAHKTCCPNPLSSPRALNLHTQTHSSSQKIQVVASCTPNSALGASFSQQQQQQVLTTTHHTHSGKLQLHYPGTWTGKIEGTMGKAKAEVTIHDGGDGGRTTGVDVIQQTPHRFLAKRRYQRDDEIVGGQNGGTGEEGGMANTLRFYSFSGAVEIFFGC